MKAIKFVHCADLHLDSPFVGLKSLPKTIYEKVRKSTFRSFQKIVDVAIAEKVDFMIIAGDIYDGEDRSIRAQLFFRKQMERLKEEGITVFAVHGNHDHLGGKWGVIPVPDNVVVFPSRPACIPYTAKSGQVVHLYGFSYAKKNVVERMIDQYEKKDGADFHIGILHGHDSVNSSHYRYAPFHLNDLLEKDFDYWALGHVHQRKVLHENPFIVYPGNAQGRHPNETGEKGCYLVEMTPYEAIIEFRKTAPIIWESLQLHTDGTIDQFDDFYQLLNDVKQSFTKKKQNAILRISVDSAAVDKNLMDHLETEELVTLLQEGEGEEDPFIWVHSINWENSAAFPNVDNEFLREMNEIFEEPDSFTEPLAMLYRHRAGKKFLEPLTETEKEEIKEKARMLIAEFLIGNE